MPPIALLLVLARPGPACGVYPLGEVLAALAQELAPAVHRVSAPVAFAGAGYGPGHATEVQLGLGWAWGTRETGVLSGSVVSRVVAWWRAPASHFARPALGVTAGRFASAFGMSVSADVGLEVAGVASGVAPGPVARAALGGRGLAVELSGWAHAGADWGASLGLRVDLANLLGAY